MHAKSIRAVVAVTLLSYLLAAPLAAYEIYHWVDANGVDNYSQWAPTDAVDGVSKQILADPAPPAREPDEDLYSVEATAEQMRALWEGMEQRREEQLQRQPPTPGRVEVQQQEPYYALPGWYGRPADGPVDRPGHRPPHPPDEPEKPPATSTLERPD
jgi:hypothetical protein